MKHGKRMLSLLLTLGLLLGCLSGLTLPASADPVQYSLWIGGQQVTDANKDSLIERWGDSIASYDPGTQTLYLRDGVNVSRYNGYYAHNGGMIYSEGPLTIDVSGSVSVNGGGENYNYGIYCEGGDLHIVGSGTLTVENVKAGIFNKDSDVYFDDPTNRTVVNSNGTQYGIFGKNVYVDHAEVTAVGSGISSIDGLSSVYDYGCTHAGVCALDWQGGSTGVIRVGSGSQTDAMLEASCNRSASYDYALYAKSAIQISGDAWLRLPAGGSVAAYTADDNVACVTVVDSSGNRAMSAQILSPTIVPPTVYYDLWVGSTQVDSTNMTDVLNDGGKVQYNPDSNTLTLNNAAISLGTHGSHSGSMIYSEEWEQPLTVVLSGTSTISGAYYGIKCGSGDLRIRGDGTLTISETDYYGLGGQTCNVSFDDSTHRPTVHISAGQYGIRCLNAYIDRAELHINASGSEADSYDSATQKCRSAAICAEHYLSNGTSTIRIGSGEQTDAIVEAVCERTQSDSHALYARTAISLVGDEIITLPSGGCVRTDPDCNNCQTVVEASGGRAWSVNIQPASLIVPDLTQYALWVDGTQVTMDNKDALLGSSGSYFDAINNELHLRGTVALDQTMTAGGYDCAIYSTLPNLCLVLDDGCTASVSGHAYGIVTDGGDLHIRGSGALSITGANVGLLCSGGNLFFDGSDPAVQPQVTVSAAQHAVQADSVYLWNVDLNAGTTGGTGDDPATYAAVYAAAGTTDGIIQIGTDGVEDWKNSATIYARAAHGCGLYAQDHLEIAGAMQIVTPARYLPFTGSECHYLRDAATGGAWAPTVELEPASSQTPTSYSLWVGDVEVTGANRNNILRDGTAYYDPGTNTLYLDGASISNEYSPPYAPSAHLYYTGSQALTIVVEGTVTLGSETSSADYGIYSTHADLHIRGSGTLDCGFKYFSCISLAGSSYDLYFDDPVNRPILRGESARYTVFAKNVYLRRAELYLHSTGSFPDDGNPCQAAAIYARISGSSTVSSGRIEIGQSTGTDNVILEASVGKTGTGFYAVYGSITPADTEKIVLPAGGGTSGSTIIDTRGRVADTLRIEPQAAPPTPSAAYDLWLNGAQVTAENKNSLPGLDGCTFDPATNTLFLTGDASFDRGMVVSGVGCAIYSGLSDLYIVLDEGCVADLSGHQYGVYAARGCRVHIRGGGTLRMADVDIGIDCGRNYSNDSGTILFDGQDPSYRPTVEIEAVRNCLLANEIYLWNVDLNAVVTEAGSAADRSVFSPIKAITYSYIVNTYNPYAELAGGIVEIGSGDGSEAWKNNAVVYATSPTNYAIFAEYAMYGDQVVTGEIRIAGGEHGERIWLPNNSSIAVYTNGPHGYYIKNTTTNAYSATVYIAPSGESPMEGTTFELWVNGFQVTGSNCDDLPGAGGSYYDPLENTLWLSGRMTLNGAPESGEDAPIYTTLGELTIVLDYGRAELCSEAHNYGIYSSGNLHIRGGSALTVTNAIKEGIHVGGTLSFDDPELTPTVSAYGHQYGLRAGSLVLRQVELNAIVYSSGHTAGDGAVANAAILADRDLFIGTGSANVSENNVTVYASCDVSGGYGIYAGQSVQHASTYAGIVKPVGGVWANGSGGSNYVQDANGSIASVVQIAPGQFYEIILDEFIDNGRLELPDHTDGRAFPGSTVRVRAVPETGYRCDEITVNDTPIENGSFSMPAEDVYVTAVFSKIPYTVTGYADAFGSVTAEPAEAGIGDEVLLRVSPTPGYVLNTISVTDADGTALSLTQTGAGYRFAMPASNVTVAAVFAPGSYTVTVTTSAHGTVTPDALTPQFGETVTLTAQPETGYRLQSVSVQDTTGGSVAVSGRQFVMPASDVTVTAVFALIDYAITVQPAAHGTVTAPVTAQMGDTVTLTVAPATGWQLDTLTVTDDGGASVSVTAENTFVMPASTVLVSAVFAPIEYAISVDPATAVHADVAVAAAANYEDVVTLTVTPHPGYTAGAVTVTDAQGNSVPVSEHSFAMPASDVTVAVQLTPIDYTVAVLQPANGSVAADKTVAHVGDVVTLTATPDPGYALERFVVYDSSFRICATTDSQFTMPAGSVIVVASFTTAPYSISIAAAEHGSVVPSKYQANAGEYVDLTVTPDEGWELASLTVTDESGASVPLSGTRFAMPQSSVTVTAVFCSPAQAGEYFVGNSLSLVGDIGVNFYVDLHGLEQSAARLVFTWGENSTETVALSGLDAESNGWYKTTVHVAAAQMTDAVTARLYNGETLLAQAQYSVAQYARYVLGASDEALLPLVNNNAEKAANLRALCRAMLIYGAKSQQQFGYHLYASADQGIDYTLERIPDGVLRSTVLPEDFTDQTGLTRYGSSLVLESKTTYRLYFTVTDPAKLDALTVKRGTETLDYGTRGSLIYFDIADIAAAQVFRDFTLNFGDSAVTCNAGQYATSVLGGSDQTLKDAVTALYWYSAAAKAYFGVS